MDYIKRAREVLAIEAVGIESVRWKLDDQFGLAVEAILKTIANHGKVVVVGVGKNWHIGSKIAATLNSTGTPSAAMHPIEAMHGDFGMLADHDILLAISYSGASDEIVALIPSVKRCGISVIALTADISSPLGLHGNFVIDISIPKEACPFNMAPTTSTTATLALGDALAMVLLEARGFKLEDYARRHPGGAIGRALSLCVGDIMRTGARLATVPSGQPVREAILAMTAAKSGSVAIINPDQTLAGILTDGDLRRHMIKTSDLIERSVDDVMTSTPITLTPGMLVSEALNVYAQHNVDDLVVVDGRNRTIGSVDIQDMPKLKMI